MMMIKKLVIYLIVIYASKKVLAFWPPVYKVNFTQEEIFIISEQLNDEDINDVYQDEEEIIKQRDLKKLHHTLNNEKFYRLHRDVKKEKRKNFIPKENSGKLITRVKKYKEFNPDIADPSPWEAAFIYETSDNKEKRENSMINNENYDYIKLKNEYNENIQVQEKINKTLNYTEVKETESVKEAIRNLVNFQQAKNCTEEERKGIGGAAIKCLWNDIQKPRIKNKKYWLLEKILRIILIWTLVYVIITVPLWCQYGWCCCCCRCKFCFPTERINEVKRFFADNPLGVYHDENGKKHTYEPTNYERYAQKNLGHALMNL